MRLYIWKAASFYLRLCQICDSIIKINRWNNDTSLMKVEHWSYFCVSHLNHWKCCRVRNLQRTFYSEVPWCFCSFHWHVHILAIAPAVHVVLTFNKAIRHLDQVSMDLQSRKMMPWQAAVNRRVATILHWGPQKLSAEGARIEAPKASRGWWLVMGCPLPNRLGGLGRRRQLCQHGLGRSPGHQRIFYIFEAHRTLLIERTVLL